ncbi:MAG: hypothetical protein JSR82_10285 [Verrucomicrobia bacterium]|nr:hypothetical protein [Verrucomicrobiota bacterium]
MRLFQLCLSLLALTTSQLAAQSEPSPKPSAPAAEPLITEQMARRAIARFRADPTSQDGREAALEIMRFADKSPLVNVIISPKSVPWIGEKIEMKHNSLLLAAFVAGNVRSQMDSGNRKDDPVAGVRQALETYRKIREQVPDFRVASLEKFAELEATGKLTEYLAEK